MKQRDIKPCAICERGLMHNGLPLFFRLKFERMGFDRRAIERQHGLEMVIGHAGIAAVMGPNDDMAKIIDGPHEVLVCEDCVQSYLVGLHLICERAAKATTKEVAE